MQGGIIVVINYMQWGHVGGYGYHWLVFDINGDTEIEIDAFLLNIEKWNRHTILIKRKRS